MAKLEARRATITEDLKVAEKQAAAREQTFLRRLIARLRAFFARSSVPTTQPVKAPTRPIVERQPATESLRQRLFKSSYERERIKKMLKWKK